MISSTLNRNHATVPYRSVPQIRPRFAILALVQSAGGGGAYTRDATFSLAITPSLDREMFSASAVVSRARLLRGRESGQIPIRLWCCILSSSVLNKVGVNMIGTSQQKQHSSTDTVSPRFSRANGNNTVTPPSVQTVTVYSVVGTLYTDFKDDTVLFTVELRITDRPSLSLYRPSGASSVKVP